jgi:phosphatidate cytidylyltransferase
MNSDLPARLKTAGILLAVLLFVGISSLYWCFFHWLLLDIAILVVVLSCSEYVAFSQPNQSALRKIVLTAFYCIPTIAVAYGVSVLGVCDSIGLSAALVELLVIGFALAFSVAALLSLRNATLGVGEILRAFGEQVVALVFLGFCASFLPILASEPGAFKSIAWFISVVAVNDSVAYFAGRKFGKHPVALVVSPKKTFEGSISGLLAGALIGGVLALGLLSEFTFLDGMLFSLILGVASQMGDLIKSLLKRAHNTKDSGTILPGHGGILDRVDGLIGAAPLFFLLKDWFIG